MFIPTNLDVADGVRKNFGAFYAALFDATVEKMGRKVRRHRVRVADDRRAIPARRRRCRRTISRRWGRRPRGIGVAAPPASPPANGRATAPDGPRRSSAAAPSWVLTRLHARYSKETLSEDLIFREAKPAMGGRANWNGTNGDEGASVSQTADGGVNNFQGRYIIRHYWNGPVACEDPRYDTGAARPATDARADADRGQGAGDRAAREGRADGGGALAGAAARHRRQAAATGGTKAK